MDSSIIAPIIIATIAIIPGAWSLLHALKIENNERIIFSMKAEQEATEKWFREVLENKEKTDIPEKPIEKPVISIRCVYCKSINTSGSMICSQCGAPLRN